VRDAEALFLFSSAGEIDFRPLKSKKQQLPATAVDKRAPAACGFAAENSIFGP
jgi:hypothetical protein